MFVKVDDLCEVYCGVFYKCFIEVEIFKIIRSNDMDVFF